MAHLFSSKKNHIVKKNPPFAQKLLVFPTPDTRQRSTVDPRCGNMFNT